MPFAAFLMALAAVAIIVIAFVVMRRLRSGAGVDAYPYKVSKHLFTPAELAFLAALEKAVENRARVFGKVRIADVIEVSGGLPQEVRRKAFNQICAKHFDFVLCHPATLRPVCVIELNDRSHQEKSRRRRDVFVAGASAAAGLPLLFVPAQREYDPDALREEIVRALAGKIRGTVRAGASTPDSPLVRR